MCRKVQEGEMNISATVKSTARIKKDDDSYNIEFGLAESGKPRLFVKIKCKNEHEWISKFDSWEEFRDEAIKIK